MPLPVQSRPRIDHAATRAATARVVRVCNPPRRRNRRCDTFPGTIARWQRERVEPMRRRDRIVFGGLTIATIALAHCGARTGLGYDLDFANADAAPDAISDARLPCIPGPITLTRARPAVMFVLDRSRSMAETISGRSRWTVLTDALASTLPSVNDTMHIGALIYPLRTNQSCEVPKTPDIPLGTNNVSALITRMRALGPNGSTPTADALENAGKVIVGFRAAQTARALVLATDGAPGCNAALDPKTCRCLTGTACTAMRCLDDARTVSRIRTI